MLAPHARGTRRTTARPHAERGAAAVEFALVVPILLLLMFGMIQYGMYFYTAQGGSDISRSAARLSAVGRPATCADFRAQIRSQIESLAGSGSTAVIRRTYSTAPPNVKVGDTVTVVVEFRSPDLRLPIVPRIRNGWVTTTVTSRVDFVPDQPQACP